MKDEFEWLSSYEQNRSEYFPFAIAFPTNVNCTSIFLDPGNTIVKISQKKILVDENGSIKNGVDDLPERVSLTDTVYRRMDLFTYFTNITSEPDLNDMNDVWGNLSNCDRSTISDIVVPSSVRALHGINTVYIIYKRSSMNVKRDVKSRKNVQFKMNHNKTRRR